MVSVSLFLSIVLATSAVSAGGKKDDPVCIIGAGPAGLSAAKALEDKGHSTVIFEKRPEVGGKCQAYYENGQFHPLGAVIFTKGTYIEAFKIVESTGVPYTNFTTGIGWTFDWKTGGTEPSPAVPAELATALMLEFGKYSQFWQTAFAPFSVIGYKNGVPPELAVPASEWLALNGFQVLGLVINDAMVTFGYGDYREVPTLFVLQFFTPDIIASSMKVVPRYIVDFHEVFTRFAKSIKGPIKLNSNIRHTLRWGKSPTILYTEGSNWLPRVQKCSSLVVAFPPTLSALSNAGLSLSSEEKNLFGAVRIINYFSSTVRMTQIPPGHSFWLKKPSPFTPASPEGQPVYFQPLHSESNIANVWSWDKYGVKPDEKKVRSLLLETLSKVNRDPRDASQKPVAVTKKDVVGFSGVVDYFPHIGQPALIDGWYEKFNKLQGSQKTYYASGLNGFETVEFAVRAGKDITSYI